MKRLLITLLFAVIGLSSCGARAEEQPDKTLSPYFWVKSTTARGEDPHSALDVLPLKSTLVEATVAGVIADVRVTQVYTNTGTVPLEAVYIFPGSTRAAVHGFTMTVGDRRLEAKIKKREEARRTYEVAKAEGKTTSLLEQQRPNVFQMNVANIMPSDEIRVELRYTELLVPTDGIYAFIYPGVVGPRYSNKPAAGASSEDTWVANPYLKTGRDDTARFQVQLRIAAGMPLQDVSCRTHETRITYTNDREATLATSPEDVNAANRDFICQYRLAGGAVQSGLLLAEGESENFFLLMLQPPARSEPASMPPRELIFVVDVSGSMNGFPLSTAKQLMRDLLPTLRPLDSFNILLFAGGNRVLAPASLPATPQNIRMATEFLENENGGGGTELLPALKTAFAFPRAEGISRSVAVITDGYVDIEAEAFEIVRGQLSNANVFAFGIGSSVNRHLIEGLARAGKGEPFIVTEPEKAAAAAAKFREYISSPVLTGISVKFDGVEAYAIDPAAVPDVLAQRPVIIQGKWRGARQGTVTLKATSADKPYEASLSMKGATLLPSPDSLSRLWARTRIAELGDFVSLRASDERVAEITNLGLTYSLLTKYTSFVAVDEVVRRTTPTLETLKQPLPLPQGVENSAVGQPIATSPEPAAVGLIIIAALLLLLWRIRQRKIDASTDAGTQDIAP